jgi:hypothetical protein
MAFLNGRCETADTAAAACRELPLLAAVHTLYLLLLPKRHSLPPTPPNHHLAERLVPGEDKAGAVVVLHVPDLTPRTQLGLVMGIRLGFKVDEVQVQVSRLKGLSFRSCRKPLCVNQRLPTWMRLRLRLPGQS